MATICCLGQQLMVMTDLNPSHTCEPKSCSCSYFTTFCPMCDITASSLPVLAVPVLASRMIWTLRLPGSCLFPDLTQKKVQRFEKKQEAGYKRGIKKQYMQLISVNGHQNIWQMPHNCFLKLLLLLDHDSIKGILSTAKVSVEASLTSCYHWPSNLLLLTHFTLFTQLS